MAVAAHAAHDTRRVWAELRAVRAAVCRQRRNRSIVIWVPDLDCAVPGRGQEGVFGYEVPVHAEDFASVLGPGLDRELGNVYVEEFD